MIDFPELHKVLTDFANDFRDNYTEHLEHHGRFTTLGNEARKLINSVQTHVVVGEKEYEVTISLEHYWKYVESGVYGKGNPSSPYKNPGWGAYPHILEWIQTKPILPRPNRNGIKPTNNQLAYLITRKIVSEGTQGSFDMKVTKDNLIPWYRDRISQALGHDMENYIRKLVKTL